MNEVINSYSRYLVLGGKFDDAKGESALAFSLPDAAPTALLLTPAPQLEAEYLCISSHSYWHTAPNIKTNLERPYSCPMKTDSPLGLSTSRWIRNQHWVERTVANLKLSFTKLPTPKVK